MSICPDCNCEIQSDENAYDCWGSWEHTCELARKRKIESQGKEIEQLKQKVKEQHIPQMEVKMAICTDCNCEIQKDELFFEKYMYDEGGKWKHNCQKALMKKVKELEDDTKRLNWCESHLHNGRVLMYGNDDGISFTTKTTHKSDEIPLPYISLRMAIDEDMKKKSK